MTTSLLTNCSGLVLKRLRVTFLLIGFYTSSLIIAETPRGDFMSLIIVGGFGRHFKLNSYKIYPASVLMNIIEPFSSPTSKGKYSTQ